LSARDVFFALNVLLMVKRFRQVAICSFFSGKKPAVKV